ncbi:hypothetical protein SLS55_002796 [Diplodia seriata]|uniref:Uncharacterized protein n=1 Tax=Diplodia seriata TaxID=420778 RepID=A0ABR3CNW7_9PEZI
MRARMNPLAQSPLGSVWTSVSRRDFERNIDELERKRVILEPRDYTDKELSHETDATAALPLPLEHNLADDFAYISAYDVGVDHITAATIEYSDSSGITVRLAANEGVEDCVQAAIKEVFRILKECNRRGSHREQSEEDILSIVVRLNKNRIYSRLRSRRHKKSTKGRKNHTGGQEKKLLSLDLKSLVGRQDEQTRNKLQELATLRAEIDEFISLVEQVETSEKPEPMEELKEVVKKAWLIAERKIGIKHRLGRLGVPGDRLDSPTIQDMDKIANYWRICQDLVRIRQARETRHLLDDPQLEVIENYKDAGSASKECSTPRYVHAEVQLIAYYEASGNKTSARIIGASREACFLCDAFIKAHGCFSVSKAHRQVMNIWTVPERKDYGAESLERVRRAIMTVNSEIRQELKLLKVYHQASEREVQYLYKKAGQRARHGVEWHTCSF